MAEHEKDRRMVVGERGLAHARLMRGGCEPAANEDERSALVMHRHGVLR